MVITKIFIASQAGQDTATRMELSAFFLQLNNCYINRGIYFTPVFTEDIPDNDAIDRELACSSLAVIILGRETPDADFLKTYGAAHDMYNKTGKPKISVYEKEPAAVSNLEFFSQQIQPHRYLKAPKCQGDGV